MIVANTHRLIQWLALVVIAITGPFVLLLGGVEIFWPVYWPAWLLPLVAMGEFSFHVMQVNSQRQVRSLLPAVVIALVLVGIRLGCSVVGAVFVFLYQGQALEMSLWALIASLWMGSPIIIALEMLLLMIMLPVGLHRWAPGFLNQHTLDRFTEIERQERAANSAVIDASHGTPPEPAAHHARPFIYSYEDLDSYYQKVIGLEGFLMLNEEGLVVWDHLPWNAPVDDLAGEICRWILSASQVQGPTEEQPRLAALQGGGRWTVALPLSGGVMLCLFFTDRLAAAEVSQLIPRLREAAQSLITYRSSDLAAGGGVAHPTLRRG